MESLHCTKIPTVIVFHCLSLSSFPSTVPCSTVFALFVGQGLKNLGSYTKCFSRAYKGSYWRIFNDRMRQAPKGRHRRFRELRYHRIAFFVNSFIHATTTICHLCLHPAPGSVLPCPGIQNVGTSDGPVRIPKLRKDLFDCRTD